MFSLTPSTMPSLLIEDASSQTCIVRLEGNKNKKLEEKKSMFFLKKVCTKLLCIPAGLLRPPATKVTGPSQIKYFLKMSMNRGRNQVPGSCGEVRVNSPESFYTAPAVSSDATVACITTWRHFCTKQKTKMKVKDFKM